MTNQNDQSSESTENGKEKTIKMQMAPYREWKRENNKNADGTVQKSIDGTKQIKRKQEAYMDNEEKIRRKRGRHEADRGRHEADRGRHEAELWNEDI
ncbi:hypothetical protein T11_9290, partial [Trichinella zimbabwensis]